LARFFGALTVCVLLLKETRAEGDARVDCRCDLSRRDNFAIVVRHAPQPTHGATQQILAD